VFPLFDPGQNAGQVVLYFSKFRETLLCQRRKSSPSTTGGSGAVALIMRRFSSDSNLASELDRFWSDDSLHAFALELHLNKGAEKDARPTSFSEHWTSAGCQVG
jgi:hypothetical protein